MEKEIERQIRIIVDDSEELKEIMKKYYPDVLIIEENIDGVTTYTISPSRAKEIYESKDPNFDEQSLNTAKLLSKILEIVNETEIN